jgi:hypothetical protein
MTYQEAKKLVKERGLGKYQGRRLVLLQKLTDSLYLPNDKASIEGKTITRKIATIQGWLAGVSDRQLRTIIKDVEEITVVSRTNGAITVVLNLALLNAAEKVTRISKRTILQRKEDRATKARTARAAQRTTHRVSDGVNALRDMRPAFLESVLRPHKSAELSEATKRKFAQTPYRVPVPACAEIAPCAPPKAVAPPRGRIIVKQAAQ